MKKAKTVETIKNKVNISTLSVGDDGLLVQPTIENTAHVNALAIAEKIQQVMGNDFFTIEQMRKKMFIIGNNNRQIKLSWNEARNYITSIANYGLVETIPAVKDCFKIRLDDDFQLRYFDKQIDIRNNEIADYKKLMQTIFDKDKEVPAAKTKPAVKKASPKPVVVKKSTTKKAVVKKAIVKKKASKK